MRNLLKIALPLVGIGAAAFASADVLQNVSFWIDAPVGTTIDYEAQVSAWTGNLLGGNPMQGAIGNPIYNSGFQIFNGSGGLQLVSFQPNVNLAPGNYVADLSIVGGNGTAGWGALLFNHVAGNGGGGFNFYNNATLNGNVGDGMWDDFADFGDLAWTANFSSGTVYDTTYAWDGSSEISAWGNPQTGTYGQTFVVTPEPASFIPVAAGVIGLMWRRRKSS